MNASLLFRWSRFAPAIALACTAAAQQQPGVGFAVIGVPASQTARINVLNEAIATAPGGPPRDSEVTPGCQVVLQFYGSDGQVLKEQAIDGLAPGKIAFLDFTPADKARTPIRAVARFGYSGGAQPMPGMADACRIVPSLEIFDTESGKTQILLTDAKPLAGGASRSTP